MQRKLSDSVVVITGASSGIGRATALAMAEHGATVVLSARRQEPLEQLAGECERRGGRALVVPTDVTDEQAVEAMARHAIETLGRIDVWVNNAAVTLFGRLEEAPIEPYRRVLETNLFGTIHGARAAIPYFREQGSGVLINLASVTGRIGQPYTSAYCASKFAIIGLSECLRQELLDAPDIHVCTILPASVDTPLFQHAANYTGRAIKPLSPVYAPERVAEAIVRCVQHPQREVVVGPAGHLGLLLHTLAPATSERRVASKVEQDHFQQRTAEPTDGNVLVSMPGWVSSDGGWRREQKPVWPSVAVTSAAVLAIGLLSRWLARTPSRDGALPARTRSGRRVAGVGQLQTR